MLLHEMFRLKELKTVKEIGIQGLNTSKDWYQIFIKQNDYYVQQQALHKIFLTHTKKNGGTSKVQVPWSATKMTRSIQTTITATELN